MNKRQKIVQENFINNEEAIIKRLKQVYNKSLQDITAKSKALQDEINSLNALADLTDDENEKAILKSREQSKIYQKQYQDALKKQVGSILDNMQVEEFKNVSDYLRTCYEDGFVGTMYDLQGQGIPLCFPMDQEAMVRAVQLDSKISQGLYERLGEDVSLLKKKITAQVSRGISTGMSFAQVAQQLSSYTNIGFNNAVRIARTEGHRVQTQGAMDACYKAKDRGADVVKQWDSTLDAKTRESHVMVDGEVRELDEKFSNGLMFPSDPSGGAAEVVNCRCALLQRARWALDEEELQTLKDRAAYYGLNKSDGFEDFKKKYLKAAEIEDCTTTEQVVDLFKSHEEWFYELKTEGKVFRSVDGINLDGCDLESAKAVYRPFEAVFEKFPQLKGKLNAVNSANLSSKDAYADCFFGLGHGGISVSKKYFSKIDVLKKAIISDESAGFHPKGLLTPDSVVMHELGHAIDDYLSYTLNLGGFTNKGKVKTVSAMLRPKVMKECGLTVREIQAEVSGYATKDSLEWFGECFSEYMCSENPRRVATEFGRQLEEIMKGVK